MPYFYPRTGPRSVSGLVAAAQGAVRKTLRLQGLIAGHMALQGE